MFYLLALAATTTTGNIAGADNGSIVTCGGVDCDVCKFLEMISNTFNYLLGISFAVAAVFLIVGGFVYIGSRGNDNWMFQAKRAITWSLTGFGFVLLAWLAIQTTFRVIGVTDASILSKFQCKSDFEALTFPNLPQKKVADILKSANGGGITGGQLAKNTNLSDITKLFSNLGPKDILIIESMYLGQKKPFAVVGKTDDKLDLLYIDRPTIRRALDALVAVHFVPKAMAATTLDDAFQELAGIVQHLLQKNQQVFTIIADKPEVTLDNPVNSLRLADIMRVVNDVDQCIDGGGFWYRFDNICQAEQEKCQPVKCTSSNKQNFYSNCGCPAGKCLVNGRCLSPTAINKNSNTTVNKNSNN